MRIKSGLIHISQALLEGALVAALIVMLAVGTTFAAKGGQNATTGTALAVRMVTDSNGNGAPNWNDWITFNVSTTATDKPWVRVDCSQNGAWVYTASAGFFASYAWNPYFDLASTMWTGGAAECTASLYKYGRNGKVTYLSRLAFSVGG